MRISKDPSSTTYDDHYYRVYLKPMVTTAHAGAAELGLARRRTCPLTVGQVVETCMPTVAGWVMSGWPAAARLDHVYVIPDADTGRVAVSMQVSSVATATAYREYWGSMNVEPMGRAENST